MTVSMQAKEEISVLPAKACCRRARFAALLRTAGSIIIGADGMRLQLSTDDSSVSGFAAAYVFEKYGGETVIKKGKHITVVFSGEYVVRLLAENGVLTGEKDGFARVNGISPYLVKGACCIREYVRGAFLGCGFVSSDFHHLEFAFSSPDVSSEFAKLLSGVPGAPGEVTRGDKYVVYYSGKARVSDALSYLGAVRTALGAADSIIRGDIRRRASARSNCDLANIDRALKASEEQIAAIRLIDKRLGLDKLDEKLAAIARLREAYPASPLTELAEIAGLTKSGVKHRIDKLIELADKYKDTEK